MTYRIRKIAITPLMVLLFACSIMAQANLIVVQALNYKLDDSGLSISFSLTQSVSSLTNPRLLYQLYKNSIPGDSDSALPTMTQGNSLAFSLPTSKLSDADEVEVFIRNGDAAQGESSHYRINLQILRELKTTQAQVTLLTKANATLEQEKRDILARNLPSAVVLAENAFISDTQAFFHFKTTSTGKIKAVAIRADNSIASTYVSDKLQTEHAAIFGNLTQGQPYTVEVVVLNHLSGDTPIQNTRKTVSDDPRLQFTTSSTVANPTFSKLNVSSPDDKSVVADVALDQADGFLQIDLEELVDPSTQTYKLVDSRGKIGADDIGRPNGAAVQGTPYTFVGLKPETQYRLTFRGGNKFGKATLPQPPPVRIVQTLRSPPSFEFSGSVNLVISPLAFTSTWAATTAPEAGSFDVVFNSGTVTSQPAQITGNTLTAALDVTGLRTVLDKSKNNEQPILRFTMRNKQGVQKTAQMTITTVLPKATEVQASQSLSVDEKKKLLNVIGAASDSGKKFKWQDLLSTGLGILLKFL